jgi:hypothetical protein
MKKSARAALYDRLAKVVGTSDEERKELRASIAQSSDEELHAIRWALKTLELAHRITANAKIRNVLRRKSQREEGIRFLAKCASRDLKASRALISYAARKEDKLFFITLGKCLSGETKEDFDQLNLYVAWIICRNPSISAKDAVRELKEHGGWTLTEDHFRVIKKRMGLSASVHKPPASDSGKP